MEPKPIEVERNTKETQISASVHLVGPEPIRLDTPLPFFNHMLHAMAFHGRFSVVLSARGDVDVDPHHLVEDTGLVLGSAVRTWVEQHGPVRRFGHAVVPMDDALAEVTVDISNRPYLVYRANYPQERAGSFDLALIREFLGGFANRGGITLHAECRYGLSGHHMAEALFKALGRALAEGLSPMDRSAGPASTKGLL
jgi:imidazoleglycerol-phosphate dehydratase